MFLIELSFLFFNFFLITISSSLLLSSFTFCNKFKIINRNIRKVENIKKLTGLIIPTEFANFSINSIFKLNIDKINNNINYIKILPILINFFFTK